MRKARPDNSFVEKITESPNLELSVSFGMEIRCRNGYDYVIATIVAGIIILGLKTVILYT